MAKRLDPRERRVGVFDLLEWPDAHAVKGVAVLCPGEPAIAEAAEPFGSSADAGQGGKGAGLDVKRGHGRNRQLDHSSVRNFRPHSPSCLRKFRTEE